MAKPGETSTLGDLDPMTLRAAPNTPFWLVGEGRTFALGPGEHLIGRGIDCQICFPNDTLLSRRHARLVVTMSQVEVEDLGSSNGTWIGSTLVQHRMFLAERQTLRVGKQELRLRRSHTARDRRSSVTSRDVELADVDVAAEDLVSDEVGASEIPTFEGTPVGIVHKDASAMLDAGRTAEARRLVEPVLQLMDRLSKDLSVEDLERVSVLCLRLAAATRDRWFADWVVGQHDRQGALMSETTTSSLLDTVSDELRVDERKARHYLSTLRPAAPDMSTEELLRCARLETALIPRG